LVLNLPVEEDVMAKLVVKDSKIQNYVILLVLVAVFVYVIFFRK
jgi:hypothetical protein